MHGRPISAPPNASLEEILYGGDVMRDAQADVPLTGWLRAQLAFKNSMIHGILQFTPSIAFCYVLHRCLSLAHAVPGVVVVLTYVHDAPKRPMNACQRGFTRIKTEALIPAKPCL
ncbi:hypothetical protein L1987_25555 [Smallanthus sonchifolius]|uniref:Uncharacterized protein n=1 Tax=Smallanthus sonchifolius TaxID=185202 RepID=A0ACB9IR88_9ASTR|nr:hypothetical protein L1987_25555 [Smallanthus sonchifolius]